MNIAGITTPQMIGIVVVVLVVIALIAFALRKNRSARLRKKFGDAEYERAVAEHGRNAETLLEKRTERVKTFHLRTLSDFDRSRFQQAWAQVQARFVDGPAGAVTEADQLLGDLMAARGYPVGDFETRAADISVDHPTVVQNYRAGHDIAVRHLKGQASTEDLRRAMIHYRALFEDLIGERTAAAPANYTTAGSKREVA